MPGVTRKKGAKILHSVAKKGGMEAPKKHFKGKAKSKKNTPLPTPSTSKKAELKKTAPADSVDKPKNNSEPAGSMVKSIGVTRSQSDKRMVNKQKILVLASTNINSKTRHLMQDLKGMLPHTRGHEKVGSRDHTSDMLKELCTLHHCNSCVFMEGRKKGTTFMWLSQMPAGPSCKFELVNVHTADEMRMAGNCLKYSRALLHFDHEFEVAPHLRIMKSMLSNLFNVPHYHPKSKPFIDHIICFFYLDGRIWIRHYQIVLPPPATPNKKIEGRKDTEPEVELKEDGPTAAAVSAALHHATKGELEQLRLMEIGPRMVLNPLTILNGAFSGSVIYKNKDAQTPTEQRMSRKMRQRRKADENQYLAEKSARHKLHNPAPAKDPLEGVFA